jgi:hypothetical protein
VSRFFLIFKRHSFQNNDSWGAQHVYIIVYYQLISAEAQILDPSHKLDDRDA